MVTAMLAAVMAGAVVTAPAPTVGFGPAVSTSRSATTRVAGPDDEDPAVRVTLNGQSVYDVGDRARVHLHVRDDSYLVVLMADPSGAVHVLYPAKPSDDAFVRGGTDLDIRGATQDASFVVESVRGTGTVYAAVSKDPFHFDAIVNGDEWASNALPDTARSDDAEAVLTDVVQRMATPGGRFDYDLATYTVTARAHHNQYASAQPDDYIGTPDWGPYGPYYGEYDPWYGPGFGVAFGGPWWGFGYSPWWGYAPGFYGAGFFPAVGFGGCFDCFGGGFYGAYPGYFGHAPLIHRPGFGRPIGYRPRAVFAVGHSSLYPGHLGGTAFVHGGFGARPAVFARARLAAAPGGVGGFGYREGVRSPTVFRQVHADGPVARPGAGRVMVSGGEGMRVGGGQPARAVRAIPLGPRASMMPGHVNAGGRAVGTPVGPRNIGPARVEAREGNSGPAHAYRVESPREYRGGGYNPPRNGGGYEAPRNGGGYEPPRNGGGGYQAPRGGGGYQAPRSGGETHAEPRGGGGGGGGGHAHGRTASWGGFGGGGHRSFGGGRAFGGGGGRSGGFSGGRGGGGGGHHR